MKKSDLINLLGKVTQEEEVLTNPHERVLLIDGLNLFFRNFAMMNEQNAISSFYVSDALGKST